jgi:hypothetical protein
MFLFVFYRDGCSDSYGFRFYFCYDSLFCSDETGSAMDLRSLVSSTRGREKGDDDEEEEEEGDADEGEGEYEDDQDGGDDEGGGDD